MAFLLLFILFIFCHINIDDVIIGALLLLLPGIAIRMDYIILLIYRFIIITIN